MVGGGGGGGFAWKPKHVLLLPLTVNSPQNTFVRHCALLCCWQCHVSQLCKGKAFLRFHCSRGYANAPNHYVIDCVCNVMAHAQKPDFVFRRNGRVHLNRRGRQFSRLLAAEVCASAVVMLDTPCSGVQCKTIGYPLHSPVSPLLPLPASPCAITFQLESTYIARLFSKCSPHAAPIASHLFANRNTIC